MIEYQRKNKDEAMILRFCFSAKRYYYSIEVIDDIQVAHIAEQNDK